MGALHAFEQQKGLAAREREALVVQRVEAMALDGLTPAQRAEVEDMHPALACREELVGLMDAAPSPYWAGFAHAVFLMRLGLAEVTGREF